jgi:putative transposase
MKNLAFLESQIFSVRPQYEGGRASEDICHEHAASWATLYQWRKKYAGMDSTYLKETKALQEASHRLIVLDNDNFKRSVNRFWNIVNKLNLWISII